MDVVCLQALLLAGNVSVGGDPKVALKVVPDLARPRGICYRPWNCVVLGEKQREEGRGGGDFLLYMWGPPKADFSIHNVMSMIIFLF